MLQQTRVETVIPYYERFLDRFPDVATLAGAEEDEVLAMWSGLGYYRRARQLLAAAKEIVANHGGALPRDPEAILALPGIGRYTAGAISSIAFDLCEPILDGNVRRVLSRISTVDAEKKLWELAAELAEGEAPGDLNQALMELGATVCSVASPACDRCPARADCKGHISGDPERYPKTKKKPPAITQRVAVPLIERNGSYLFERPTEGSPFRGRWDLPSFELDPAAIASETLPRAVDERHGLELRVGRLLGRASHGIMNRRLRLEVYACRLQRGRVASNTDLCWIAPGELDGKPVSGATRKVLRALGG